MVYSPTVRPAMSPGWHANKRVFAELNKLSSVIFFTSSTGGLTSRVSELGFRDVECGSIKTNSDSKRQRFKITLIRYISVHFVPTLMRHKTLRRGFSISRYKIFSHRRSPYRIARD